MYLYNNIGRKHNRLTNELEFFLNWLKSKIRNKPHKYYMHIKGALAK